MTTTIYTVTSAADLATDIAAIDAASQAGTGSGMAFEIDIAAGATLSETAALPAINLNGSDSLTIQGNGSVLNGNAQDPGLNVVSGAVTIDNLTIENALTLGSNDGGFGVGGGLFVGRNTTVTLNNVSFANDAVTGGTYYNPNGGVALGGDIFVQQNGTLTIEGGVIGVGSVSGGGGDAGDGIYIESTQAIMLAPGAGQVTTINGVIADENSLDGSINAGTLIIDGAGTVLLNPEISPTNSAPTANTFAGGVKLQSGTLELASAEAAGTGAIVFGAPATGNPFPVLKLDAGAFSNGNFANAITGFNIGDTIDLVGLSTQSVSYVSQTQTLTVGGDTINLSLKSNLASANFSFATASDGNGGTDVMLSVAPPTVRITSPAESSTIASQTITGSVTSSSGAIVVGQILTLTDNGVILGTTQVASNGSFTTTVTLPNQGSNSIVASLTDSFGNTGSSAAVIDGLYSLPPTIKITSAAESSNVAGQTITGSVTSGGAAAAVGQTVTLTDNGVTLGTAKVAANGAFTTTVTLPNLGTNSIVATVTDSYGNSASSNALADILLANPTISGTLAGQTSTNGAAVKPFANVVIGDQNAGATETVFVTLTGSGQLADGAGFSGLGTSGAAQGIYVLQGGSAQVTKELDALVFTPAAASPNTTAKTSFMLTDVSTVGTVATDSLTTVTNSDLAVAPTISGAIGGQVMGIQKTIAPFAHVTISDPNANSTDTIVINVSGGGTLSDGAGFSNLSQTTVAGVYAMKAVSAAQASAEVEALVYTPAQTGTRSATTVGFNLVDQTSAGPSAGNTTTTLTIDPGPATGKLAATLQVGTGINLTSAVLAAATAGIKGDTLSISAVNGSATLGSFALVNGQMIYAASTSALSHIAANGSAGDTLGYTVTDQYGDTASGTVALTITNPADLISGSPFGFSTIQGTTGTDIISAYGLFNTITANGGNDVINAGLGNATVYSGSGDVVTNLGGLLNTVSGGDGWNTVKGSQGLTSVTLGNGSDTIVAAGLGNKITLGSGNNSISGGQGLETIVVGAGTDAINIGGTSNNVTLNGSHATVAGGQGGDTVTVNGGSDNLSFAGLSANAAINGSAAVNISDLGSALTMKIGSSTQTDTITGFGSSDPFGVVDLLNGAGGYASTAQILSGLHSDGHGGTMLALGSQGSIDFVGTAQSQLHASSFKIG